MGFFDGGGKSLSFGEVGSQAAAQCFNVWRGGVIIDIGEARQGTDINTKKPLVWDNGDPMMQLPITLDTAKGNTPERAESADDDLRRTLYITKGKSMFAAARAALRAAGADDFAVGGTLYVKWSSGEGRRGDARQYEMHYEPPVANSGGFMGDQPAAAPSMPPQPTTPAPGGPPPSGGPQGGPPPAAVDPTNGQPLAPPQPVWNAATGQWEIPAPAPAAPPAAPPPPPQPVWNAATGQWEVPNQQSAPPSQPGPPAQAAAPAANGWQPGQQAGPGGPPPQGSAQPAGNPFARR